MHNKNSQIENYDPNTQDLSIAIEYLLIYRKYDEIFNLYLKSICKTCNSTTKSCMNSEYLILVLPECTSNDRQMIKGNRQVLKFE